jgi:hypothetical protein
MRGEDEVPHTHRELNLLVARFHNDLSFGSTDVFFAPSDCDKEGAMTSGEQTNASFHPDGSTKTGSSPMSSDRIDGRKGHRLHRLEGLQFPDRGRYRSLQRRRSTPQGG